MRIILVSADFSKELTSAVMWLVGHDLDIRCVRLRPYSFAGKTLVDVQQLIPLPEAVDYQVQVKEKARKEREGRTTGPDFTRYDFRVDGAVHTAQWKRNAIFIVVKHLCDKGADPADIAGLFDWCSNRVWFSVDGNHDSEHFAEEAARKAKSGAGYFEPRRWHCSDGELVHHSGSTYAFSNQWGGDNWRRAMTKLKQTYPQFGIEFSKTV